MVETLLSLLIIASWVYWLIAWWMVRAFFREKQELDSDFAPPVSILKPVKGLDAGAYDNFASFCSQDYPEFELLFGVADPADPVIPVIERLQQDFPHRRIRLIVTPSQMVNRKVSLLHALASEASHEVLVISDSDVRVTPDYLRRVVAPLVDRRVGLVTCPYKGEQPLTLTARLEALHMCATFLPSVMVGRRVLAMRFAMGATIVLRSDDLARIGGFAAVAEYLADDYQMGARITDLGLRVHMSDYVVSIILGMTTFREQWDREVRWSQCNRVSRPLEYPALLLTFTTPLAVVLNVLTGLEPMARLSLAISLLLRWMVGWFVTGHIGNQSARRWLFWLPLRDMLSAIVWCAGLVGRRVVWRGEEFILQSDGRLEPLPAFMQPFVRGRWGRMFCRMMWSLDGLLRWFSHIKEFSHAEGCLLRVAMDTSDRDLILSDGTQICRGDLIGELHLWNERIPLIPKTGPDLAWARAFHRGMIRSLRELAAYIEANSDLQDVKAFRGESSFADWHGLEQVTELMERGGFEPVDDDLSAGFWRRFVLLGEHVYTLGLIWTFNPASLKGKRLAELKRGQFWISREALLNKYGAKQRKPDVIDHETGEEVARARGDLHDLHRRATPGRIGW